MTLALLIAGLLLLLMGAEVFVRGAARLAASLGISPLVIGLTVVALGTSSPEIAVSVRSCLVDQSDLALGNVVGSNIVNILLILGAAAAIAPLTVAQHLVRLDVPIMIAASVLVLLLGLDGRIGRADGLLLVSGATVYTIFLIMQSRKESRAVQAEYAEEFSPPRGQAARQWFLNLSLIGGGLLLLALGSRWLVVSAVAVAHAWGMSELIIGLTVVAVGTSLPELATSVIASVRGERDIAVGNVIGSCIFNLLVVLGVAAVVAPEGIQVSAAALRFDIPVLIAVTVACLPIFFHGGAIWRWEGFLFLAYYLAYTTYLILAATGHQSLRLFSTVMTIFVIPLTIVTVIAVMVRNVRRSRHQVELEI
ncbi:MAG: calcium/sodium antiporter [Armatimonadota bacterium]|nr:calcium/sodium antiporter [Armatimonadota bacterium]